MPPFCIGFKAHGTGDYDSFDGELNVPTEIAEDLAQFLVDCDLDVAISRKMEVDHGAVQPMEIIYNGDPTVKPMIPVFINAVARPYTKMRRVRQLGTAIGQYFRNSDKKVLFIGSGGLSHDPPVPRFHEATRPSTRRTSSSRAATRPRSSAPRASRTPSTPRSSSPPARPTSWT
jgi:2,3-dihydroxyphenylpropionate 1,2-dioxygenase